MTLRMRLDGVDEIGGLLEKVRTQVMRGVSGAVRQAVEAGAGAAQVQHPYKDQTGALTYSIEGQSTTAGSDFVEGTIVAGAPYASFVNDGTSRAQAFPFMPVAERMAAETLEAELQAVLERVSGDL